jgi:hypothetical protein
LSFVNFSALILLFLIIFLVPIAKSISTKKPFEGLGK